MQVVVAPITHDDADSFHACLDAVAREKRFLALTEAPPVEDVRGFVAANIKDEVQVVARHALQVVGWCDVRSQWPASRRHIGTLGVGLLPAWRGQGLGRRLMEAAIARAAAAGITRVELDVRLDNAPAEALYRRLGFVDEGVRPRGLRIDGAYHDMRAMALLL